MKKSSKNRGRGPDYPRDADGDALRRIAGHGSDMSKPMLVDFFVAVPNEKSGNLVARAATRLGYSASVERDPAEGSWTCYCSRELILTYESVMKAQEELADVSGQFGGAMDGWGSLGNSPEK